MFLPQREEFTGEADVDPLSWCASLPSSISRLIFTSPHYLAYFNIFNLLCSNVKSQTSEIINHVNSNKNALMYFLSLFFIMIQSFLLLKEVISLLYKEAKYKSLVKHHLIKLEKTISRIKQYKHLNELLINEIVLIKKITDEVKEEATNTDFRNIYKERIIVREKIKKLIEEETFEEAIGREVVKTVTERDKGGGEGGVRKPSGSVHPGEMQGFVRRSRGAWAPLRRLSPSRSASPPGGAPRLGSVSSRSVPWSHVVSPRGLGSTPDLPKSQATSGAPRVKSTVCHSPSNTNTSSTVSCLDSVVKCKPELKNKWKSKNTQRPTRPVTPTPRLGRKVPSQENMSKSKQYLLKEGERCRFKQKTTLFLQRNKTVKGQPALRERGKGKGVFL